MPNMFAGCESIEEVIYQAVGAGSMCWENMSNTGVFQDQQARQVAQDALEEIRKRAFL